MLYKTIICLYRTHNKFYYVINANGEMIPWKWHIYGEHVKQTHTYGIVLFQPTHTNALYETSLPQIPELSCLCLSLSLTHPLTLTHLLTLSLTCTLSISSSPPPPPTLDLSQNDTIHTQVSHQKSMSIVWSANKNNKVFISQLFSQRPQYLIIIIKCVCV